jgi:hypothetical protein
VDPSYGSISIIATCDSRTARITAKSTASYRRPILTRLRKIVIEKALQTVRERGFGEKDHVVCNGLSLAQ